MKKSKISADEVPHLDHRWCVLESFADVADYKSAVGHDKEGRIYRGCMDAAIATCRALCERFSISIHTVKWTTLQPSTPQFRCKVRAILLPATDEDCEALWKVLVAANRCVCHLEDKLIDHQVGDAELNLAVSLMKAIIRRKLKEAGLCSSICR